MVLFSDTSAAAETCAIINPELTPLFLTRNAGKSLILGSTKIASLRSEILAISQIAMARISAAKATGSAWKLPPEITSPLSVKISGLSVTAFASIMSVLAALLIISKTAPITCGWHLSEYGSCTFSQS